MASLTIYIMSWYIDQVIHRYKMQPVYIINILSASVTPWLCLSFRPPTPPRRVRSMALNRFRNDRTHCCGGSYLFFAYIFKFFTKLLYKYPLLMIQIWRGVIIRPGKRMAEQQRNETRISMPLPCNPGRLSAAVSADWFHFTVYGPLYTLRLNEKSLQECRVQITHK